jgi:hypothetical protein
MEMGTDHDAPLPDDDFVLEGLLRLFGAPMTESDQHELQPDGSYRPLLVLSWPLHGWNNFGAKATNFYMDKLRGVLDDEVRTVRQLHKFLSDHRLVPVQQDWPAIWDYLRK